MGSYGIGVGRNLATVVETSHDAKGIIWPTAIAPYEVVVTAVKIDDPASMEVAERIYAELRGAGVDVIFDDRNERPGVKFADAELIGIPYRVTIGPKGLAEGVVEVVRRRDGVVEKMAPDAVVGHLASVIAIERRLGTRQ
jgi:prolyl-tRNA synthetase